MAKSSPPGSVPIAFVDNPYAPEVFADAATGIAYINNAVRLTFESARVNHVTSPGPLNRVVIGRLILPLVAARGLRDLLVDYLGRIESEKDSANLPPQSSF